MKIIGHYWNICGIGGLLARYLDREFPGKYASIAIDRGHANKYSHNNEKTLVWNNRASVWIAKCFVYAKKLDIIHVHIGVQWLPYFRFFYPNKRIIIHVHGSKIRGRWHLEPDIMLANQTIVSTPDLLEGAHEGTHYLPNPVDEELIEKVRKSVKDRIPDAFHVDRYAVDVAKKYAQDNGLEITVFDRNKTPMPHKEFLELMAKHRFYINVERATFLKALSSYEYYIDVKRDFPGYAYEKLILKAFSLTGLEALRLGCKVIDWKGEIHEGLPLEHTGKMVARKLNAIYEGSDRGYLL